MTWWNILASVIGFVGGILGIISFFRTIKRQRPRFSITTGSPVLLYGAAEKAEFLVFDATISNLSDVANSIVEYGLIIGHPYSVSQTPIRYSETQLGESILETEDMTKKLAVKRMRFNWLATPVNLSPHSSANGFIGFPLPSIPRNVVKTVEYALIVIPSEGQPALIPLVLGEYQWKTAE